MMRVLAEPVFRRYWRRYRRRYVLWLAPLLLSLLMLGSGAKAVDYLVDNQADYEAVIPTLLPGDSVILRNGVWRHFEIDFRGDGSADNPITLRAETPGEVILSGRSNLKLAGNHIVVRGLVFRDGYSPTKTVVRFGVSSEMHANNTRLTEVVIDRFNHPDRDRRDFWIMLQGRNNRVDHNYLAGKATEGPTLVVTLRSPHSRENNHLIEENYFGHRPHLRANGDETIRIGVGATSNVQSGTKVHRNYFERCDGDPEIISNKSKGNVFTENVFDRSRGSLVLRQGGNNLVARNVFLGRGVPGTGGVRISGDRQTVVDNYMEGLAGRGYASALIVMNGGRRAGSDVVYEPVTAARISSNTIINAAGLSFGADRDGLDDVPSASTAQNNLVVGRDLPSRIDVFGDMSGIAFSRNATDRDALASLWKGRSAVIELVLADNGLLYPRHTAAPFISAGIPPGLDPVDRDEAGPSWYPKSEEQLTLLQ